MQLKKKKNLFWKTYFCIQKVKSLLSNFSFYFWTLILKYYHFCVERDTKRYTVQEKL